MDLEALWPIPKMMNTARMDVLLGEMTPEEVRDALWMVSVFESWNMPPEEEAEWRRRILASKRFLDLDLDPGRALH